MIYFITNEPSHLKTYRDKLYNGITILEDTKETIKQFREWLISKYTVICKVHIGYDVESNGLDAHKNDTVLKIIGDVKDQFIFHTPYCNFKVYFDIIIAFKFPLLGHNIKFDLKYLITEDNTYYNIVYDTMLAEQRLYMKSGLSFALAELVLRYCETYPDAMDKSIRNEFIGCNVKTFKVRPRHLTYGATDVTQLFPIKEEQERNIQRYQLEKLVYDIEFPMISIIAKAELKGFKFNKKQWIEIYEENIKERFNTECSLDVEVLNLRDKVWGTENSGITYVPEKRMFMIGGKWDNKRKHNLSNDVFNKDGTTNVPDLFGEFMSKAVLTGVKKKVDLYPNNLNYGSSDQVITIFGRLAEPLFTKQNTLAIPQFNRRQKIDKTIYSYVTSTPSLERYLQELPETIMKEFTKLLLNHRSLSKATSTYGMNFISFINPITGHIHTSFRQCFTETGRMSSGGGSKEPDKPNFQNIPSKASYAIRMRNCFMAREGYSIGTHDLSGAELIIMCSLSQDMKLLKAAKGDMHSYVAQNCWRRIYHYRASKLIKQHDDLRKHHGIQYKDFNLIKEINKNIELSKTFVVNKTKKKIRASFKPMTFGVIYGMFSKKAGETLNVIVEEGQIVINFITNEFPDVIKMVKDASAFARKHGYIVLNTRTNSRAWFPAIIEANRQGLDFSDYMTRKEHPILSAKVNKEESEARNIKIQGTQADMIKECTVVLQQWIDDKGFTDEITILSWVHDEIIDEHPDYLNGKCSEWFEWSYLQDNYLSFISDTGKEIVTDNFPELKRLLMIEVCNRYLTNVVMDVDYDTEDFWTK